MREDKIVIELEMNVSNELGDEQGTFRRTNLIQEKEEEKV